MSGRVPGYLSAAEDSAPAAAAAHAPAAVRTPRLETSELSVEAVTSEAGLRALREEWTDIFERTGEGLPFATHEWAVAWWAHFRRDDRWLRDSLQLRVLRDADGAAAAIAPFMLTERPARGPLRARALNFLGTDPNLTELRRPLVEPAREAAAIVHLAEHLKQHDDTWDWLVLSGLSASTGAVAALLDRGAGAWSGQTEAYVLALPDTWEELRSRLKRNIRESLRKCYNTLSRGHFSFRLTVAETPREVADALVLFLELHRRRADVRAGVAHADYFAARDARAFLRDVCQRLGERGATRVFVLRIGDTPVAARVAFVFGDQLYLYYSGYDPAWAHYSVMTTTLAEALRWAMASGIRRVNLSTGRDVSKTRWGPDEVTYRDATLVRPGLRARLAHATYERAFHARDHVLVRALAGGLLRRHAP